MWFNESVFYQIYTLNFCGAPRDNDGIVEHRILRLNDFMDYFEDLGINAIYFNPVFSSDHHGYDTRDYCKIDERLGTNEDFIEICKNLHDRGMRVVLDGVFNHVGRGFFAFQDVLNNRENSQYKDWFRIDFNGNSPYDDGFYYEGWEGHYELVKLNLDHPDVQNYLLSAVDYWIDAFDIDGIRLDVAYSLPRWFMAMLKDHCRQKKADFFLLGEVLGDNAGYMFSEAHLDSITDYPGFKGLWSSFNSLNMFEMAHTIKRNYGEMYRGQTLFSFVDNHDVERIASKLTDLEKLPLIYGMLFSLPGIPCIYYGSEWGQTGKKEQGSDDSLRPEFTKPMPNDLTKYIKKLISIRNQSSALQKGEFKELVLTNKQFVFERNDQQERIIVALNLDDQEFTISLNENLISENEYDNFIRRCNLQISALKKQLDKTSHKKTDNISSFDFGNTPAVISEMLKNNEISKPDRIILTQMVNCIYIYENNTVKIVYNVDHL